MRVLPSQWYGTSWLAYVSSGRAAGCRFAVGSPARAGAWLGSIDRLELDSVSTGALELVAHSAESTGVTVSPRSWTAVAALAVAAAPDSANRDRKSVV